MSMADDEQIDALIREYAREANRRRAKAWNFNAANRRRDDRSVRERNADRLAQAFDGVALTPVQYRSLWWLAGWEAETVENIASAIESARALERQRKA